LRSTPAAQTRISAAMATLVVMFLLASWLGCFWLGLQVGSGRSDQRRKRDVAELERRFKVLDGEAVRHR
jgi:uncharacterized membrane protein YciS (DUF1049 family)